MCVYRVVDVGLIAFCNLFLLNNRNWFFCVRVRVFFFCAVTFVFFNMIVLICVLLGLGVVSGGLILDYVSDG